MIVTGIMIRCCYTNIKQDVSEPLWPLARAAGRQHGWGGGDAKFADELGQRVVLRLLKQAQRVRGEARLREHILKQEQAQLLWDALQAIHLCQLYRCQADFEQGLGADGRSIA